MLIFVSIIIICLTLLMAETIYFNHQEKMATLNPLNKIFNKNKEEN